MSAFRKSDRVRVRGARVHIHPGTVVGVMHTRVRVEFDTGGYGGSPYIEDFYPQQLERIDPLMDDIAPGQVWQRKPAGYLYRVVEVGDSKLMQDIVLTNLHDPRKSRISPPGLRAKLVRRPDLEGK